jgi:hypothetical protein
MSKDYHLHNTQEFPCRYLDELLIFFKETHFFWNIEEERLAYSLSKESCIVIDRFVLSLDPKVLSMFRHGKSGAKSERFQPLLI